MFSLVCNLVFFVFSKLHFEQYAKFDSNTVIFHFPTQFHNYSTLKQLNEFSR